MFYAGAERHYVVEAILDSATRGGTVIVTAPEGGGVSTVLGHAAVRLVDYATVVRVDAEQVHSKNELMESLLSYFDVPKDDFLTALNHALAQGPLVVLVDNGHLLAADLLELLAKLQQHFTGAFAVVVGGEDSLQENVAAVEVWQTATFIGLLALSPAEASEFLLKVREAKVDVEQLAEQDTYWPQTLMSYPVSQGLKTLPWKHIALLVMLVLLILLVWAFKKEPAAEKVKLSVAPASKANTEVLADTPQATAAEPVEEIATLPPPKTEPRKPSAIEERAAKDIVFDPEAAEIAEAKAREEAAKRDAEKQDLENVALPPLGAELTEEATKVEPGQDAAESISAAETESEKKEHNEEYRSQAWLKAQDPNHWMAQIILASSEQQAQTLCEQLGIEKSAYYRAIRNDRSAYIVLLGSFPTREEAKAAMAELPAEFAEKGPFLRQLQQIQAELR